jgi:Tol biopolymer transport system component
MPPRVVGNSNFRLSLSPDGEKLAFAALEPGLSTQNAKYDEAHIFIIPSEGGEPRQISPGLGISPSFSPDGKLIAYVTHYEKKEPPKNIQGTRYDSDLWVVNSSGSTPIKLAVADGGLGGPVWSPDGRFIAATGRTDVGGKEIWIYLLSPDASSAGKPAIIKLPGYSIGHLSGWTPENELGVFIRSEYRSAVYTVPSSGGRAVQVTPEGIVYYPRWSPDGKRIFLRWVKEDEDPPIQIVYVPAAGGNITKILWPETELMTRVPGGGHNISPDGRKMVVSAAQKPYNSESYVDLRIIPLDAERPVRLTNDEEHEKYPCWSPDGKWIGFVKWQKISEDKGFDAIYRIPAEGGKPIQITSVSDSVSVGAIAFTHDGKRIAFFSQSTIKTIPVEGGESEVLINKVKSDYWSQLGWSPDGLKIAFNSEGKIWITTLATGEKTDLKTGLPEDFNVNEFDWSPDGQKITFMTISGDEPEFWLISNFLPLEKLAQKNDVANALPKPKFTKIKIPTKLSGSIQLSPDGKDLALVSDKKLWIMPLKGNLGPDLPGKPVQLNADGIQVENSGLSWSYDGKWIAFNEFPLKGRPENEKWNQSIFVVPSAGGKPLKVLDNFRASHLVNYRISLSPEGKNLAYSSIENDKQYIYNKEVLGSSSKKLTDIPAREPVHSPDGKWIAYVDDKTLGIEGGNLWMVSSSGGVPKLLAKTGNASSPVWSPDGNMIAFLDYNNNKQINFIQVPKDMKATVKVTSIDAPEGTEDVWLLAGWASGNKIGVELNSKKEYALYTLSSQGGQATKILNDCWAMQPRWSRDGNLIIYVTPQSPGPGGGYRLALASVPSVGGNGKLLPKDLDGKTIRQLGNQSGNRLSPDGKTIVTAAWTAEDTVANIGNRYIGLPTTHIWKISIDGNRSEKITNENRSYADVCPSWSPDGKKIAFIRMKKLNENLPLGASDSYSIYTVNSSGGDLKLLISESDKWVNSPVWSPDGKMIAYFTAGKNPPNAKFMNIYNLENGVAKVVGEVPVAGSSIDLAWSSDSKRIAFNDREGKVIKVMKIDDGTIEDIQTNLADDITIYHLDWSTDGKQFVFGGEKGGITEFWVMEDFLPLINK